VQFQELCAVFRIPRGDPGLLTGRWTGAPRELRRKGRAIEEAVRSVHRSLGRVPNEQEIAQEMKPDLSGSTKQLLGD